MTSICKYKKWCRKVIYLVKDKGNDRIEMPIYGS